MEALSCDRPKILLKQKTVTNHNSNKFLNKLLNSTNRLKCQGHSPIESFQPRTARLGIPLNQNMLSLLQISSGYGHERYLSKSLNYLMGLILLTSNRDLWVSAICWLPSQLSLLILRIFRKYLHSMMSISVFMS